MCFEVRLSYTQPMRILSNKSRAAALVFAVFTAELTSACPFCRVSGGDLATDEAAKPAAPVGEACEHCPPDAHAAGEAHEPRSPVRVGVAVDVMSAYVEHGYVQQDRGLIIQPIISLSTRPIDRGDWRIEPYLVWFNSFHTERSKGYMGGHGNHRRVEQEYQRYLAEPHEGATLPHYHTRLVDVLVFDDAGGGWFETEIKPGIFLTRGPWTIDLMLKGRFFPSGFHDTMLEAGAKVSFDLASVWSDADTEDFSLKLSQLVLVELKDDNGPEDVVLETSIEPTWRWRWDERRVSLSLPVTLGTSPDGFYRDSSNDETPFGFVSVGVVGSTSLNVDPKWGKWFLNAGVTYTQMLSDSTQFTNGGDEYIVSGRVGFGIAF
jgi:hypothetical protein